MISLSSQTRAILDGLLSQAIADGKVPGAVFAAASAHGELYSGAAGLKSFGDPAAGNLDENSVFWTCSMTKLVVTLALLQLIEKRILDDEAPVETIIPEVADPVIVDDILSDSSGYKPAKGKILIKHLLNHTSGLYLSKVGRATPDDLPPAYTAEPYKGNHTVAQFFELIRAGFPGVPLAFEPGTNWAYGYGYDIAAFVVERVTGKSIEEYCKELIFGPLDMDASFHLTASRRERLVKLTYRQKDGRLEKWADQLGVIEQDPEKLGVLLGGIGLYSTMKSYLSLLRHLLLVLDGQAINPILSRKTVANLFKPSLSPHMSKSVVEYTGWIDTQFGHALCIANSDWPRRRRKGSGFWFGWAGTYYFMDPTTGIAVVYGTQLMPGRDLEVERLWGQLEEALYSGLEA
ncbi:hypothetical protein M413DRAFT_445541 [Hebeloma cylindrosporum]|uniref:Beta-lactamase-related domain-containing protein n=1 Tax=Hebeloma cylindrosporum TaxID=76867 RepID=A0A0C3CBH3_HEBCY|nr:hypothetical protein M413DRAFT_445541 [Hebeloma cylindrosporum h7]